MGHLRVTIGHLRVTVGLPRVTMGHLRLTNRLSLSKQKENTTPKVRPTCTFTFCIYIEVLNQFVIFLLKSFCSLNCLKSRLLILVLYNI